MIDVAAQNAAFYWATIFFRSLQRLDIKHVVISPGSRSTPLVLAAGANPSFKKHVVLDERSAAFTALGIAKSTNNPAVLICTSGTAVANYYPAVIEARKSGVPLILATADRPPHLRATGSNQTIDQLKIFGDYTVFFHEVGGPVMEEEDLNRLKMAAEQAVYHSTQQRGPVHLNFPFRKPLEPEEDFLNKVSGENTELLEKKAGKKKSGSEEALTLPAEVKEIIANVEYPLIMIGPTAPDDKLESIGKLAKILQCPVVTESPFDTELSITGADVFLRNEKILENLCPDTIFRFGFQPTSKGVTNALKQWKVDHHIHFASNNDFHDATYSTTFRIPWMGRRLYLQDISGSAEKSWINRWKEAEKQFSNSIEKVFKNSMSLTDGHVYRHFTPQIPTGCFVVASNSFPARDIHLFGKFERLSNLFLNRGASGIDGVTSTALGISIGLDRPGIVFTGDLAFLHDSNALLSHSQLQQPLVVVIINNSGGSIFRMLPVHKHEQYFQTYFETPQSVNIEQLAEAHGVNYRHADNIQTLMNIELDMLLDNYDGLSIIECKTDAEASMKLRNNIWDSV